MQVQVIIPTSGLEPTPIPMSTYSALPEINESWPVQVTGTIGAKIGNDTIIVDDGSWPVRAFPDGYNGNFADVDVVRLISVRGPVSEGSKWRRTVAAPRSPERKIYLPVVMRNF